jgi:hypothetical protein
MWRKEAAFSLKFEKLKPLLKKGAAVGAIFAIVFLPWIVRNYLVFGRFQAFGTNGGMLFYKGNNKELCESGELDYGYYYETPELKTMSHHEVSNIYARRALDFIVENPWMALKNFAGKVRLLYSESIDNFDDLPFVLFGLLIGAFIVSFLKLRDASMIGAMLFSVFTAYIYGRHGFNVSALAPNVEFGFLKYIGFLSLIYVAVRKIEPQYIIAYFMLLMVNIVFIPQHRQRWIIDSLFIIWTSIAVFDFLKFMALTNWQELLFSDKKRQDVALEMPGTEKTKNDEKKNTLSASRSIVAQSGWNNSGQ